MTSSFSADERHYQAQRKMGFFCAALASTLLMFQFAVLHADYTVLAVEGGSEFCASYNPQWGGAPPGHADYVPSLFPNDSDGCSNFSVSAQDQAVVVLRGNCTFYAKALNAQTANATFIVLVFNETDLVVVTNELFSFFCPFLAKSCNSPVNASSCITVFQHVYPIGGDNDSTTITIPVVITSSTSGEAILSLGHPNLTLYTPSPPPLGPSAALIFVIAVTTVLLASYFANTPWEFLRYGLLIRKGEEVQIRNPSLDKKHSRMLGCIVVIIIILMFSITCSSLLLLYFFYHVMVYIIIVMYCIMSLLGLYNLLSPFAALIPLLNNCRLPKNKIPIFARRPDPKFFILLVFCVGVVVWWVVERHAVYAWILQDILGFAFIAIMLMCLKFLRVWMVAVLMILLLFYDIFMVFITPLFTPDHVSIMEKAVTGGGGSSGSGGSSGGGGSFEPLPIVFMVPKFLPNKLQSVCADYVVPKNFTLLGYGDVGIPALLVVLALKFDLQLWPGRWTKVYYPVSGIAYAVGMMLTLLALALMKQAQPALLYLVPTTLGSVTVTALIRREFVMFFTGKVTHKPPQSKDEDKEGVLENSEVETNLAFEEDCPEDNTDLVVKEESPEDSKQMEP